MKEFIDETSVKEGTPINRANLMAIQGFVDSTIRVDERGNILQIFPDGEQLTTVFHSSDEVVETFIGQKVITKTTRISGDTISVEVS